MTETGYAPRMSDSDFASLGNGYVAYIKPVVADGIRAYEIRAADGTPLTLAPSWELAAAAIRQHGLEPVSVN